MRVALGVSYRGSAYQGWQSQPGGNTVQDRLEAALAQFLAAPVRVMCAGRTDAGVHALNQVVHLDTEAQREPFSWVRGTNRFLPDDIAVQWCRPVDERFHARNSALGRRYRFVVRQSPVIVTVLWVVLIAPVGEELLFRGAIWGALRELTRREGPGEAPPASASEAFTPRFPAWLARMSTESTE